MTLSQPPQKLPPNEDWAFFSLWQRIREVVYSLPEHFKSIIVVRGINATEIYAIGSVFSNAIESSLVEFLNENRHLWDVDNEFTSFLFRRQSQTFPDVLLVDSSNEEIIFGIELKAWYALSKEEEPSFRFKIDPDACAEADLIVVFPWLLSDIVAGNPVLLSPYIEFAKYSAEMRNYQWSSSRASGGKNAEILRPNEQNRRPYPNAKEQASDSAQDDRGNNFGRIARRGQGGLLDNYVSRILDVSYLGIKIKHWIKVFKAFSEGSDDEQISGKLGRALSNARRELTETLLINPLDHR